MIYNRIVVDNNRSLFCSKGNPLRYYTLLITNIAHVIAVDDYILAFDRFGDIRKCDAVKDTSIWSQLPIIGSIHTKRCKGHYDEYSSDGSTINKSFKKAKLAAEPISAKSLMHGRHHGRSRSNPHASNSKSNKMSSFSTKSGMQSEKLLDIVKNLSARVQKKKSDHAKKDLSSKEKNSTENTALFKDSSSQS